MEKSSYKSGPEFLWGLTLFALCARHAYIRIIDWLSRWCEPTAKSLQLYTASDS